MPTLDDIQDCLPQTQCELCGHPGCKPYAEALLAGKDTIDKCEPGGKTTVKELSQLLNIDPAPYLSTVKKKPASIVKIREAECIGCRKCIQACPIDAIIGAPKQMHVILTADCSGCNLCIPPCPMDCIETILTPERVASKTQAKIWRARFEARNARLVRLAQRRREKHLAAKNTHTNQHATLKARQATIQAALERTQKNHE